MSRAKGWTFKQLRGSIEYGTETSSTVETTATSCTTKVCNAISIASLVLSAITFGVGWAVTDGFWGFFKAPDMSTGSYIYSAMQLRKDATGDNSDDDLENIVHFVISDMGGKWTYRELHQRGNVRRMDIVLFYHPDIRRAPPNRYVYNQQLSAMLPDRMHYHKSQYWWGTSRGTGASSCICGVNDVDLMQVFYNFDDPMSRVAVVAHEYYHVLQIHHCPTVYDERTHFVMWISEGAATVMQHLYIIKWLRRHVAYRDHLFDPQYGHVKQMMDRVKAGTYTYDSNLHTHTGAQNNYVASTTAILYLIYRKGGDSYLKYMLVDFLFTGDCDLAVHGGMDAGFFNAFGIWPTVSDFYADLNTFLANAVSASIEQLRPNLPSIIDLFNHTELCSDVCKSSRNGVCDASCEFGSDCTDCGPVSMPDSWPVNLQSQPRQLV